MKILSLSDEQIKTILKIEKDNNFCLLRPGLNRNTLVALKARNLISTHHVSGLIYLKLNQVSVNGDSLFLLALINNIMGVL